MKKNRYDVEVLTRAADLLDRYQNTNNDNIYGNAELEAIKALNVFMIRLKKHLVDTRNVNIFPNEMDVFQVITEISFDKLEKDVMGVN